MLNIKYVRINGLYFLILTLLQGLEINNIFSTVTFFKIKNLLRCLLEVPSSTMKIKLTFSKAFVLFCFNWML